MQFFRKLTVFIIAIVVAFSACDDSGSSGDSGNPATAPSAPGAATVEAADLGLGLSWVAVSGATSYEVWFNTENNTFTASQSGGDISTTSHTIISLTNGTTYYVWLKAKNSAGTSGFGPIASGEAGKRYIIAYNTGPDSFYPSVELFSFQIYYNGTVTVSSFGTIPGPEVGGVHAGSGIRQRFSIWNDQPDGSGTDYAPGSTFTVTQDVTLYMKYTDDDEVIGKIGPAMGYIFYYDEMDTYPGLDYLEAYTSSFEQEWSNTPHADTGATGTDIGTGEANTNAIVTYYSGEYYAAHVCRSITVTVNGTDYSDWFLPSRDELYEMYVNLACEGLGDFYFDPMEGTYYFWSSSEVNTSSAYNLAFDYSGATPGSAPKGNPYYYRPVRSFLKPVIP